MSTIQQAAQPAPDPNARAGNGDGNVRHGTATGRMYVYLSGLALVLAVGSLESVSTPSYDPWAWLVWGRQLLHGTLDTAGGPTWKPLPVLFTTIFALFGHLQPYLWLVVARWGFILSVFMAFRVAARLVWWMRDELDPGAGWPERLVRAAPMLLAGVVAASGVAFYGGFASDSALGYSEGLAFAFTLIAFDRAVDGHHRQAFAAGLVVAWDRPESWLLWGPYGLWLMWKDPGARGMVISFAVLTLLAWFLPQKLGGGSFTSGVSRAHNPRSNSAAYTSFPFWTEFRYHALISVYDRAKAVAFLGVIASLVVTFRARGMLRTWLHERRNQAVAFIGALGILGVAWWALIALETQAGFSGNDRYLVLGSGLIYLSCAAAVGWVTLVLTRLLLKRRPGRARPLARPTIPALLTTLLVALVFAFLPSGWVGKDMLSIPNLRYQLHYQAYLRVDMEKLIADAGGYKKVVACGPVMVEDFQVPMAAWQLHEVFLDVRAQPGVDAEGLAPVAPGAWPATIFQDRYSPHAPTLPQTATIKGWESQGAHYVVTREPHMTMYQDCRG